MAIELSTLYGDKDNIGCDLTLTEDEGNKWKHIEQLQDWLKNGSDHGELIPAPMKKSENIQMLIQKEAEKIFPPFIRQIGLNAEELKVNIDGNIYINCKRIPIGKNPIHDAKVAIFILPSGYGTETPHIRVRSEIGISGINIKPYRPIILLLLKIDPPTKNLPNLLYDDRNARWLIDNVQLIDNFLKSLDKAIELVKEHHLERIQHLQKYIKACPDDIAKQIIQNQIAAYILTDIFQIPIETFA